MDTGIQRLGANQMSTAHCAARSIASGGRLPYLTSSGRPSKTPSPSGARLAPAMLGHRRSLTASDVQACVSFFKSLFYRPHLPYVCPAPGSISDEGDHELNTPFSSHEVSAVLSDLRNGVSCGSDGIPGEFLKFAVHRDDRSAVIDNILVGYLVVLFQHMFEVGKVPEKWGNALLTQVFKPGRVHAPTGQIIVRLQCCK
jgi:hypothetical protein